MLKSPQAFYNKMHFSIKFKTFTKSNQQIEEECNFDVSLFQNISTYSL